MLAENDSSDYYYKTGIPRIRIIDFDKAIAYYSLKMFFIAFNVLFLMGH